MKTSSAHVRRESVPSRELSTFILHRDTGVTDPERPFKSQCSCGRWFTALDWHLHGCWTGSECQYDEPPGLDEYEKFLAYDLLSEALGQVGVLAPIRYEHPPVREDGEGNHARVYVIHRIGPPADGRRDRARRHPGRGAGGVPLRPAGLRRPVAPVRVARGLRDWRTGSRVLAGGDRHVYDNHVDQFLEQLGREPYPYPTIEIRKADSLFDYQYEDFKVVGYQHRPIIKTPVAV